MKKEDEDAKDFNPFAACPPNCDECRLKTIESFVTTEFPAARADRVARGGGVQHLSPLKEGPNEEQSAHSDKSRRRMCVLF